MRLENQRVQKPEYDRGGNARGGARYAAGKRAENAIFVHCFDCAIASE